MQEIIRQTLMAQVPGFDFDLCFKSTRMEEPCEPSGFATLDIETPSWADHISNIEDNMERTRREYERWTLCMHGMKALSEAEES